MDIRYRVCNEWCGHETSAVFKVTCYRVYGEVSWDVVRFFGGVDDEWAEKRHDVVLEVFSDGEVCDWGYLVT